jgi:glutaredoxin
MADLKSLPIILYTRQGCHLCESAGEVLRKAQERYGFTLTTVDVDSDAALVKCYGDQVPVVIVDGQVRFHGRVNPVLLERLLKKRAI